MNRTLLIDADIIAYQASAGNQRSYDWGEGVVSTAADLDAAKRHARTAIDGFIKDLDADEVVICLSDDFNNFRKRVYPAYKSHRSSSTRPVHLYDIKDWLAEEYPTRLTPWLEADDVMGILSTEPHEGQRIIVSMDKDMQTVPGWLYTPGKDKAPRLIAPDQAQLFMLWQALTGDQTDGYPGCPGCGKVQADKLIYQQHVWGTTHREVTKGPRKGEVDTSWTLTMEDRWTPWEAVVSAYQKAGFGPKEAVDKAITQVNLARILTHSDYSNGRVIPWEPQRLTV